MSYQTPVHVKFHGQCVNALAMEVQPTDITQVNQIQIAISNDIIKKIVDILEMKLIRKSDLLNISLCGFCHTEGDIFITAYKSKLTLVNS